MSDTPKHSPLGASSAERWLNCPGSVALIESLPFELENPSPDAALGTEAHALAAYCLQHDEDAATHVGDDFDGEFAEPISEEMAAAVQVYLDDVRTVLEMDPDAEIYVEERFALTEIDPLLWGTNDCAVWLPKFKALHIWDYKHGVGVPVAAEENAQLRYYGIGAWTAFRDLEPAKIVLSIVQPRAPGRAIKSTVISPLDLFDFSLDLKEGAERTREPNAPLAPGPWCDKTFCKARARCPALRNSALAAAHDDKGEIADPTRFDAAELGRRLREARHLEVYLKALWEHAEREAAKGKWPAGWKLVQGNGKRTWNPLLSEAEIAKAVASVSNAVDPWKPRALETAPAIEKALGKKPFAALLEEFEKTAKQKLVTTKPGGVSLAPDEDKRPAYHGDNGDGFEAIKPIE